MFRKFLKSCVYSLVVVSLLVSLTVPAFAVSPDILASLVGTDFFSWLLDQGVDVVAGVGSFFDKSICAANPNTDKLHDFEERHTMVGDKTGYFYVCRYCGKSAGEALTPAYDDYVATLPATGYSSSGGLLWSPNYAYVNVRGYNGPNRYCSHASKENNPSENEAYIERDKLGKDFSYSCGCDGNGHFQIYTVNSSSSAAVNCSSFYYRFFGHAPVTGTYTLLSGPGGRVSWGVNGSSFNEVSKDFTESAPVFYAQSVPVIFSFEISLGRYEKFSALSADCNLPVYSVVPAASFSGDTYNINTRPTSITGGNYGIVGDNGQITKVEDNSTIINETNNTYYNPATGQTVPITGWTYDYSDRSYKVTMEGGKTSTVTYGDENISITETTVNESGDTITNNYTIYYLIDGAGSETTPCEHTWSETSTTPATCTLSGSKLLTCSKCQQTKTETIPALGHDWQVKQSVTTEYDDTGQLIQEGYIIYECSRCHEQYKAASGTSPPVNPSDPDASGDGVFSGIFGLLLDFLGFFWKTFRDFTKSGVKAFLSALQDGTSDIFGLLNPFDWSA